MHGKPHRSAYFTRLLLLFTHIFTLFHYFCVNFYRSHIIYRSFGERGRPQLGGEGQQRRCRRAKLRRSAAVIKRHVPITSPFQLLRPLFYFALFSQMKNKVQVISCGFKWHHSYFSLRVRKKSLTKPYKFIIVLTDKEKLRYRARRKQHYHYRQRLETPIEALTG